MKLIAALSIMLCSFIAVPDSNPIGSEEKENNRGPVYVLPYMNSCANYAESAHYHAKGRFSTNGTIDFSQTDKYHISPTNYGGVFYYGAYLYIYKTTTGQIYIPYDDGFTHVSNTYYSNMACKVIHY